MMLVEGKYDRPGDGAQVSEEEHMSDERVIAVDLAAVYETADKDNVIRIHSWGDKVEVEETTEEHVRIRTTKFVEKPDGSIEPELASGFIVPSAASGIEPDEVVSTREEAGVLKVDFVDVQQGDATAIETPGGRVVLVDGGNNQLFARYLASRYRDTSEDEPRDVECIVVTHGDADHFSGLVEIQESESHDLEYKRFFMRPRRVYHNGLVKRPSSVTEKESFGESVEVGDKRIVTELETDLLDVDDSKMNQYFLKWKKALATYEEREGGAIEFRRLAKGDNDAFDFLDDEDVKVEVLGPILTREDGVEGLRFLGEPEKGPRIGHHSLEDFHSDRFSGISASHTINGHSVVLRLTYRDFSFLFAGDLNEEAEIDLLRAHENEEIDLRSEVLKAPHHGSDDFLPEFVGAIAPMVSVISSGDESARTEYIHPRATLVGALGKHSRAAEPIIFVTELVAFFKTEGFLRPEFHKLAEEGAPQFEDGRPVVDGKAEARGRFFAFSRAAFGLVMVRTDGDRLLVCTNSGRTDLKEAYAFGTDDAGETVPVKVRRV
jgi:beta-lactamase superfamily II metal-dependent hydrolase